GGVRSLCRYGATPGARADLDRLNLAIDVRPALSAIRAPTLILHKTHDPWVPVEQGRFAAKQIAGARFVELPGNTHALVAQEGELIVREIREFFEECGAAGGARRSRIVCLRRCCSPTSSARRRRRRSWATVAGASCCNSTTRRSAASWHVFAA